MTHREKVDRLVRELRQRGVSRYTTAPPLFRILWAAGLEIPPPFFIAFLPLMLLVVVSFGVLFGALAWLTEPVTFRLSSTILLLLSATAGLLFGVIMATYFRWKATRLGLTSWREYGEA